MTKKGEYNVQGNPAPRDTSFRSFICALLVFLALCLAIYLILALVINKEPKEDTGQHKSLKEETEALEGGYDKSEKDKLTAIKVPDEKEYERTTGAWTEKDVVGETTKITSTARTNYETTSTLGNDIHNEPETKYKTEKIPLYTKGNVETTTDSMPLEDKNKTATSWRHTPMNVPTTIYQKGTTSLYKGTTNVPHVRDSDQNASDASTEEDKETSTESHVKGGIDQSTTDSITTENDVSINFGLNDTLFYQDIITTAATKNAKESITTEVPRTSTLATLFQTIREEQYSPLSTTEEQYESTTEEIVTIFKKPFLRTGSKYRYVDTTAEDMTTESGMKSSYHVIGTTDLTEESTTEVDIQKATGTHLDTDLPSTNSVKTKNWNLPTTTEMTNVFNGTAHDQTTTTEPLTTMMNRFTTEEIVTNFKKAFLKTGSKYRYIDTTAEDMTTMSGMKSSYHVAGTTDLTGESTTEVDIQKATGTHLDTDLPSTNSIKTKIRNLPTTTEMTNVFNGTAHDQTTTTEPLTTMTNRFTTRFLKGHRIWYPPLSTTDGEYESIEASTTENIRSTSKTHPPRLFTGSSEDTTGTYTSFESTTNVYQKIDNVGSTTEDATSESVSEESPSTTDSYVPTTKSVVWRTVSDSILDRNHTDTTAEDMTTESEINLSSYHVTGTTDLPEKITTDIQEATSTDSSTDFRSTNFITTESWNLATTTEMIQLLSTTTSKPLTTQTRNQPTTTAKATPPSTPETCTSEMCKKSTSKLLYLMSHDTDRICENFYDFACGGQKIDEKYEERQNLKMLIHYLDTVTSSSERYLRDFKTFYESCVQHERNFKYSPRMEFLSNTPDLNLTELFVELILTQSMPLFDIGVEVNKDTQAYRLQVTLPGRSSLRTNVQGWSLVERIKKECLNTLKLSLSEKDTKIRLGEKYAALKKCESESFKSIAENFVKDMERFVVDSPIYNETNLQNLFNLMNLIQYSLPDDSNAQQTLVDKQYGTSSIGELKDAIGYDFVDWETIFSEITFRGTWDKNLVIFFKKNLESLFKKLKSTFTESELSDVLWLYSRLQLYVNTGMSRERESREMYCMDLTKQLMPDTTSVITYKTKNIHFMRIVQVMKVFRKLKTKLIESITNSSLADDVKNTLGTKLGKTSLQVISTGDHAKAIQNSQNIRIGKDDYQTNVVESLKNYRRIVYSLAGNNATPASLLRYFVDPFYTRPKLFEDRNVIVAQAAFFEKNMTTVPEYIKLATMEMHLNRELAKIITDSEGRNTQYYDDLIVTAKDLLTLHANNSYNVQGRTVYFDITQNLWINPMIVDNIAFKLTLDSFKELVNSVNSNNEKSLPWISQDYPADKTFFIAAAQEYCEEYTPLDFMEDAYITGELPPPLRVQNFLSNTEEFDNVFECGIGTPMVVQEEARMQFPSQDYEDFSGGLQN